MTPRIAAPLLSVIVPTYNEYANVPVIIEKLTHALGPTAWEVIFVDDNSRDKTAQHVRSFAAENPQVRVVHRIGRRGLSGACIEGMLASSAPYLAVMDADGQHDETRLPVMLDLLQRDQAQLTIGSRYVAGGTTGEFSKVRLAGSKLSTFFSRTLLRLDISDPMSGFFMIRQEDFLPLAGKLSSQGFKILLDLLATARGSLRVVEVPFTFGTRVHGESKMDSMVVLDFLGLLVSKATADMVPVRFFYFTLVGGMGLVVHLVILRAELGLFDFSFAKAQSFAVILTMTFNFFINNQFTYRSQRLKGLKPILRGLFSSYAVWSIGALANVAVASVFYEQLPVWWLAASLGAVIGSVWNYITSSLFVWRAR
ncbi:MAG: glycosyltransferase [Rickettsiales bacterium]